MWIFKWYVIITKMVAAMSRGIAPPIFIQRFALIPRWRLLMDPDSRKWRCKRGYGNSLKCYLHLFVFKIPSTETRNPSKMYRLFMQQHSSFSKTAQKLRIDTPVRTSQRSHFPMHWLMIISSESIYDQRTSAIHLSNSGLFFFGGMKLLIFLE